MAAKYKLNLANLCAAATLAGDVRHDGRLHLSRMARRTGVDAGVLSRITRNQNGPSRDTLGSLADAYKLSIEQLISAD